MRAFADIERELGLKKFIDSANGTLYCVPPARGAPRVIVRRFDRQLPPSLVPAYAELLAAAQAWIERDPELAQLVRVEQPREIGADFIARTHFNATALAAFLETDPEEDPPDPPPELAGMQGRFRLRADGTSDPRDRLVTTTLARSVLEPTRKTFYDHGAEQFVIADLKPTRDELDRWRDLAAR